MEDEEKENRGAKPGAPKKEAKPPLGRRDLYDPFDRPEAPIDEWTKGTSD